MIYFLPWKLLASCLLRHLTLLPGNTKTKEYVSLVSAGITEEDMHTLLQQLLF